MSTKLRCSRLQRWDCEHTRCPKTPSKWFLTYGLQLPSHIWPDQNQLAEQEKHIISAQTGLATTIKRIKIAQIGTERIQRTATSAVIVLFCLCICACACNWLILRRSTWSPSLWGAAPLVTKSNTWEVALTLNWAREAETQTETLRHEKEKRNLPFFSELIVFIIHCSHPINSTSSIPLWPFCYVHIY